MSESTWIPITEQMPLKYVDVLIRLKDNPNHNPGRVVWGGNLWYGYFRNYFPEEVTHWAQIIEENKRQP